MNHQLIVNAVRDHAATLFVFRDSKTCVFAVNLKWKDVSSPGVLLSLGGKFYLGYLLECDDLMEDFEEDDEYDVAMQRKVVECGAPANFDIDSDRIALFECEWDTSFV